MLRLIPRKISLSPTLTRRFSISNIFTFPFRAIGPSARPL
jgi:hypothetical protein